MVKTADSDVLSRMEDMARRADFVALGEILTKESTPMIRRRAMELLFEAKVPEAYDTLADAAAGAEVGLNEEILNSLRARPGDATLRAMARVLSSENSIRRAFTISLLAQREESASLTMLLRGARDPVKSVCRIAERALIHRISRAPSVLAQLPRESIAGIVSIVPLELAQELLDPKYPAVVRGEAAKRLAIAAGAEAVATLMALSSESDPILARAAWEGFRLITNLPATFLLPFLADRRDEFRRQGLELFARTCGRECAPIVTGLLKDKAPSVREEAVRTLFTLLGEESIPLISKLARDPEVCVRRTVLQCFGKAQSAQNYIIQMALEEKSELRDAAMIEAAKKNIFCQELANDYLTFLDRNATEQSPPADIVDAMAVIAKILGDAHEPRALSGFAALCRTTSRRLRRIGIEAVLAFPQEQRGDVLVTLSDTHDRAMLSAIALALGEVNDPRATLPLIRTYVECGGRQARQAGELLQKDPRTEDIEFLVHLLANKWASARRYSAAKLKNSKDERVVDPLLKASEDEDTEVQLAAIEALSGFAKINQRVVERLINACAIGDITVRQAAVEALGDAQIVEAVPNLIKALHNIFLRPRAVDALKKVGGRQGYLAMKRLQRREQLFGGRHKKKKEKKRLVE